MKAVILDMDGVIVDSERQWRLAEDAFFERLLRGAWRPEDHGRIVGLGVVDLYDFLVREYGLAEAKEGFLAQCQVMALDIYGRRVSRTEGLPGFLADLKERGVAVGVATSSPRSWVEIVLSRFSLEREFAAVLTGDDAPGRTKPEPDLYLLAASALKVEPARCLAIEDSRHGVTAAKRAGMACLAFRNGHNDEQDLSAADGEFRGFAELRAERLEELLARPC